MSGLVEAETVATLREPRRTARGRTWRRLMAQPVTVGAGLVLVALFVAGALAPRIAPNPQTVHLGKWVNHAPMWSGWHVFGTDNLGRDMAVRMLWALHWRRCSRVSWGSCSAGSRDTAAAGSIR